MALLALIALLAGGPGPARAQSASPFVLDDFESYHDGARPSGWKFVAGRDELKPLAGEMDPNQFFHVASQNGNKFLRGYTHGEALRITQRNGHEFDWNLKKRPYLQWRWRAHRLPKGASEKGDNDTGAAVYVTFGSDWLGRPKSVKYTYSSTLPVGTTVDFGPLKVIVVASGAEPAGHWQTETRDVASDIHNLFGEDAPDEPLSITLWSDTDTTGGTAKVDFDDLRLLSHL